MLVEPGALPVPPPSAQSLHARIRADIEQRIMSGVWPPGHRIPFEHELMTAYACSRMTVSKALTQLAQAGLLERRRKVGSVVARPQAQSAVLEIRDIRSEVAALGLAYQFTVTARRVRRSSAAQQALLNLARPERVLGVRCRHDAGGQPFCFEERLINLAAVPEAATATFADIAPGPWLLARVPWIAAEHKIRSCAASGDAANALKLALGAPCLVMERRTWNAAHPVTFVRLTYPGDAHELVARFTPAG
jgi:GntR family transcriptional regulator, histidine utilization repressor